MCAYRQPSITSPTYSPRPSTPPSYYPSPTYTRTSPTYTRTSPTYTPTSPTYTPTSPTYTPTSPTYTPTSPTTYTPSSPQRLRAWEDSDSDDEQPQADAGDEQPRGEDSEDDERAEDGGDEQPRAEDRRSEQPRAEDRRNEQPRAEDSDEEYQGEWEGWNNGWNERPSPPPSPPRERTLKRKHNPNLLDRLSGTTEVVTAQCEALLKRARAEIYEPARASAEEANTMCKAFAQFQTMYNLPGEDLPKLQRVRDSLAQTVQNLDVGVCGVCKLNDAVSLTSFARKLPCGCFVCPDCMSRLPAVRGTARSDDSVSYIGYAFTFTMSCPFCRARVPKTVYVSEPVTYT
jgi:hypothetical protein